MSKTREILRARWGLGLTVREASRATNASTGVVSKAVNRAKTAGLTWEQVDALTEAELEHRLYGGPASSAWAAEVPRGTLVGGGSPRITGILSPGGGRVRAA